MLSTDKHVYEHVYELGIANSDVNVNDDPPKYYSALRHEPLLMFTAPIGFRSHNKSHSCEEFAPGGRGRVAQATEELASTSSTRTSDETQQQLLQKKEKRKKDALSSDQSKIPTLLYAGHFRG